MTLNSDFVLYHPLWVRANNELVGDKKDGKLFNRLVDVFVLACAIGIKEDRIIEAKSDPNVEPKTIGRNTFQNPANQDIYDLLDFMLNNAIVTSKIIDFTNDERLKLCFSPDFNIPKFSPTNFLVNFANYGIVQIFERIKSNSISLILESLNSYFDELADKDYDSIIEKINISYSDLKN